MSKIHNDTPEMIDALEDLAKNGSDSAKIQALKLLWQIAKDKPLEALVGDWAELDKARPTAQWRQRVYGTGPKPTGKPGA